MRFRLILALAALLALAWPAAANDADRDFLTGLLEDTLSDAGREVRVIGFQGALSSRATIAELTIADDEGIWIRLTDVVLDWNRAALLRRRLEVNELRAGEIDLIRTPGMPEAGPAPPRAEARPFALPDLPVSIRIDTVAAERVTLGAALFGTEIAVSLDGTAQLEDGEGSTRLAIERIDDGEGWLRLEGSFDNASRMLALDLSLAEAADGIAASLLGLPGRPSVALSVEGSGPLDDFVAQIGLQTDGQQRLEGAVELLSEGGADGAAQRFRARLNGDIAPLFVPEYQAFFGDDVRLLVEGASLPDGRLELSELDLSAGKLALRGELDLGADRLPRRILLRGTIADPDGGRVRLPTGGPRTMVDRAVLDLDFDHERSDEWDFLFRIDALERHNFTVDAVELTGSGLIAPETEAGPATVAADLAFRAEGIDPDDRDLARALGRDLAGHARVDWTEGAPVVLPSFGLAGESYALNGAGRVDGAQVSGRIDAQLEALERFSGLAGRSLAGALSGSLQGDAEILSGAFDVEAQLVGRDLQVDQENADSLLAGTSRIDASLRRDTSGTTLRRLQVEAQTLSADLTGTVRSDGADLAGTVDFADLAALGGDFAGQLRAEGRLTDVAGMRDLDVTARGRDLGIGQAEADNLLRGETVLDLRARQQDDRIDIERFALQARSLSVLASGRVRGDDSDLTGRLDFSDLSVLGPDYGGALEGGGRLRLRNGAQHVEFDATGRDIAVGLAEVDGLLRGESRLSLDVTRQDARIDVTRLSLSARDLTLDASGRVAEGDSDLTARLRMADLGALGPRYRGEVTADAAVRDEGAGQAFTLEATGTGLAVGVPEADRILQGTARLSLAGSMQGERLRLDRLQLSTPMLRADADALVEGSTRRLDLSARLSDLGALVPRLPGPVTFGGRITDAPGDAYSLDLSGEGPGGLALRIAGRMERDLQSDLTVQGQANLAVANRFVDPINLQGGARFDLRVQGRPGLDALSGTVTAQDVRVVSPRQAITLQEIDATAQLAGGRLALDLAGRMQRGGRFGLDGTISLAPRFPADLRLTLNRARVSDNNIFDTRISGNLAIDGLLIRGGRISGALDLEDTELRIPSTGLGANGFTPRMTHLGESAAVRETRLRARLNGDRGNGEGGNVFDLDLTLNSPNRIFLRGRGLDAELGGSLLLTGTTRDVVPSGQFSLLRGRLDILGRRFVLSEGLARLQGRFVPFIQLSATTSTDGINATILVEGEADALDIRFLSSPELPEEEVVARLLFGQGLDRLSPFQAAQLASAVATLAGRGGEGIVGNLRNSFGLDDLDVQATEDGTAALRVGKYLTENVYTDVTVDAEGRSEISLNLDLSPSLRVRGRTDNEGRSGIGIFFERDY